MIYLTHKWEIPRCNPAHWNCRCVYRKTRSRSQATLAIQAISTQDNLIVGLSPTLPTPPPPDWLTPRKIHRLENRREKNGPAVLGSLTYFSLSLGWWWWWCHILCTHTWTKPGIHTQGHPTLLRDSEHPRTHGQMDPTELTDWGMINGDQRWFYLYEIRAWGWEEFLLYFSE